MERGSNDGIILSVMGQIVIELPSRINRRYKLNNKKMEQIIIENLESAATPVPKKNAIRLTDEDRADIRAANRARKGDLLDWEDAVKILRSRD